MRRERPAPRTGSATQPPLWAGAADGWAQLPLQPERDVPVKRAQRSQITWGRVDLDAEVPADHGVRAIATVVDKLDLRGPSSEACTLPSDTGCSSDTAGAGARSGSAARDW